MNQSKLFEAIREGKPETVKRLLEEGCDPSSLEKGGYNNVLSLAAYSKQPEMIESLLKKGRGSTIEPKAGVLRFTMLFGNTISDPWNFFWMRVRTFMRRTMRIGLPFGSLSDGSRLRFSSNEAQR